MFRILYVDDEPGLLEIGKLFLEQSGEFIVDIITTPLAALALLNEKAYDAIISDYMMPDMDGIGFLKKVRTLGNAIPFILFTGRGREEVVIQALNEGADFYLQKGGEPMSQFAELSNKIRYAVMRRHAEETLKQDETRTRKIIDLVPHMIFVRDQAGNFLLVNKAVAEMYSTTVAELIGKSPAQFHGNTVELRHMLEEDRHVMTTGETMVIPEESVVDASGKLRFLQTTKVPFTMPGTDQPVVLGVAIDITERKRAEGELSKKNDELNASCEQIAAAEEELRANLDDLTSHERALRVSEEKYRSVIDNIQDMFYRSDRAGNLIMASPSCVRKLGYGSFDEIVNKPIAETFYYAPEKRRELVRILAEKGSIEDSEVQLKRKDGTPIWVSTSSHYYQDDSGKIAGVEGIFRDITRRKQIEEALEKRLVALTQPLEDMQVAFEDLFNSDEIQRIQDEFSKATGVASIITRPDGSPITKPSNFTRLCNDIIRKTGKGCSNCYKSDAIIGRPHPEGPIVQPCLSGGLWDAGASITLGGRHIANWLIGQVRNEAQTEDAMRAYAREIGVDEQAVIKAFREVPSMSSDKFEAIAKSLYTLANQLSKSAYQNVQQARFITERKRAEAALLESEEKFHDIFDLINDGIHIHEVKPDGMPGRFIEVNEVACRMLQYTHEELLEHGPLDMVSGYHNRPLDEIINELSLTGHAIFETEHRRKDGTIVPVEINTHVVSLQGKRVMISAVRDITERKRAEEALRESEERYLSLFNRSLDCIYIHDLKGNFIDANPATLALLGYTREDMPRISFSTLLSREQLITARNGIRSLLENGTQTDLVEYHLQKTNGEFVDIETKSSLILHNQKPYAILGIARDITARIRTDEALSQANRKLNLLSDVTRHDINNQMTALQGYLAILEKKLPDPSHKLYLLKVANAAERISAIIRFTKEYEAIGANAPAWQDCRTLVGKAGTQAPLGNVIVKNEIPQGTEVFADPLVVKVFYNLMDNAVRYGGKITTIRFSVEERKGVHSIVCEDDGYGIDPEVKEHIFDKGFGKNTGLGLALAREILDLTGIEIHETGESGTGARFEILVPDGRYRFTGP
jgi:PAS domain S-box-containing protein